MESSPEVRDRESSGKEDYPYVLLLDKAWKCVIEQFTSKCQTEAVESGSGINLFRFLRSTKGATHNCEYFYAEHDSILWKSILTSMPNRIWFEKAYQPEHMYAVCVSVPLHKFGDDTIQMVRLFKFDTHVEIEE